MSDQSQVSNPSAQGASADAAARAMAALQGESIAAGVPTDVVNPPAPEAKPELKSDKFAALARKEKLILQRDREIKAREKAMQDRELKLQEIERREADLKEKAKTNPMSVLEQYGMTYQQLTDFILNGNSPTPESQIELVKQELEMLKKSKEDEKTQSLEAAKKQALEEQERVIEDFKTEISSFLSENSETYELINLFSAQDVVFSTVEDYYEATGKVLSIDEASELVEKYLTAETQKALKVKKLQPQAPAEQSPEGNPRIAPTSPKTLNNDISTAASVLGPRAESDRLKRALAALENQKVK